MEREQEIRILFQKYIAKDATAEEVAVLFREMETPENRSLIEELITGYSNEAGNEELPPGIEHYLGEAHQYLMQRLPQQTAARGYRLLLRRITVAAAAVLIAAAASFYLLDNRENRITAADVMPGGSKTTLTLADGTKVDLSEAGDGIIVGGDAITYLDGSEISDARYDAASPLMSLTTPKGGTFQVILPDGTNVWLNAASTLRYPGRFSSDKREVFLEGEGFFEVSPQGKRQSAPFIVHTAGQQTTVLGTEFNISAYRDDDEIKTTLVNGSVKISALQGNTTDQSPVTDHPSLILKPNEQSINSAAGLQTRTVNIDSEIAWKNGQFHFQNTPLKTVLRMLSRWYDIDVHEQGLPDNRFYGEIPRQVPLSEVLGIIETTSGITFRLIEKNKNNERRLILVKK